MNSKIDQNWGEIIGKLVDAFWENNYECDEAKDRFGNKIDQEIISSEIRFDEKPNFSKQKIEEIIINVLNSLGFKPNVLNLSNEDKFSKYGKNLIISQWNQDKLIINLDELTDKSDPYISVYFRQSKKQNENKSFINEDKDSNIEYTCVLLDNKSSKELSRLFQTKNPELKNWKLHCHHMTIINSQLPENTLLKDEQIQLQVISSGINESCAAVKVKILDSEIDQTVSKIRKSSNKFSSDFLYIIMATSPIGKSNNVNSITEWHKLENQIKLNGHVQEI